MIVLSFLGCFGVFEVSGQYLHEGEGNVKVLSLGTI